MEVTTANCTRRMLLIDDDYTDQRLVEILLNRNGISVDECLSPTAAMPMINRNGYDAILVDYQLPILSGPQLIKKLEGKLHCPIFIISAQDPKLILKEVEKIGTKINGVISKCNLFQDLKNLTNKIYGPEL